MDHELERSVFEEFEIIKRVGKGAYGIVWKARYKRLDMCVALKKIFDAFRNKTDAQRTFREVIFLKEFSGHPNIIELLSLIRARNGRDIYLVFEYMETDLHKLIKRGNILRSIHKKYIIYQILKAVKYIHSADVIHRDLKPSNILLDSDCNAKVCDFGLTRSLSRLPASGFKTDASDLDNAELTEYVATRWYRAPEILLSSTHYTKGVDMWSVGCILAEMFMGKALFPGTSTLNQLEKIMSISPKPSREDIECLRSDYSASILDQPKVMSRRRLEDLVTPVPEPSGLDLVRWLLHLNPKKRLTAAQALDHPYVSQFRDPETEVVMDHVVVPPLNDSKKLGVSEYRSRLYDMIIDSKLDRVEMEKMSSLDSGKPSGTNNENGQVVSSSSSSSSFFSSTSSSPSTGSSTISLVDGSSLLTATDTARTTSSTGGIATKPPTRSRAHSVAPPSHNRSIHLPRGKQQRAMISKPNILKSPQRSSCEKLGRKFPLKATPVIWASSQEARESTRNCQVYPDILVKDIPPTQTRGARRGVGSIDAVSKPSQQSFPHSLTTSTALKTVTTSTNFSRSYDIPMILRDKDNRVGSESNLTKHYHIPNRQKATYSTSGVGQGESRRREAHRSSSSGPVHLPTPGIPIHVNSVSHSRMHRALIARPWIS